LFAIYQRQIRQLDAQPRNTFDAAGLLRFHYAPADGLTSLCHNDPVHHNGLYQSGGERVPGLVVVRRQRLIDPQDRKSVV
jgi:hypothetical protein